ncbi:restriction endonuclease subunit S [Winogradskyella damuponensis]|uniref:Restriction endonuclease subunit S n=1 Tax=Winogradskyella damuponensis TaxID=943939 RepID=A0ABP8CTI4_9FLAO
MKSSYKLLGDYITRVDVRNKDLQTTNLRGLSMTKEFRESTSNIVGVDLSKYKLVPKNHFACDFMSVIRVHKLPVVHQNSDELIIVSPAYTVFKVIDENILNPEYLMMWFRRPEFDRYADFRCDSAIRGGFKWEELGEVELPIPSIEKQRKIVKEYNTIVNRIKLNETLNQKLEDTAQALYKHWFVDFEFPNAEGKPYKSSGGEMVYNAELDSEIPLGWEVEQLERVIEFKNGKKKPNIKGEYSVYGGNGIIDFVNNYNAESTIIVGRVGAYCGSLYLEYNKCWISDNAISGNSINEELTYCLYLLQSLNISERREGTGQPLITQSLLNEINFVYPSKKIRSQFNNKVEILQKRIKINEIQTQLLRALESLMLAKMSKTA